MKINWKKCFVIYCCVNFIKFTLSKKKLMKKLLNQKAAFVFNIQLFCVQLLSKL